MPATVVDRPLWRSFSPEELRPAVRHARGGGISVVRDRRWYLLGDAGPAGEDLPLYVDWAIRAVEAPRWWELEEGPARGLVKAMIATGWRARVGDWIERDSAFRGTTAKTPFDCVKCAACCHDNAVVLDEEDLARFRASGDPSLMRRVRRVDGKRLLPLLKSTQACVHLRGDRKCGIYPHRPFMCRDFPFGTEQCMTSREEMFGTPFPKGR
jgi:uncharacterized protein